MDRRLLDADIDDFFSSDDEEVPRRDPAAAADWVVPSCLPADLACARSAPAVDSAPPPAAHRGRGVITLQQRCCEWLARHLHMIDRLDELPEHLADMVAAAIESDRRLLDDQGLDVWLGAVLDGGRTTALCLRWAAGLTDTAVSVLAENAEWCQTLCRLDLAFCEQISDRGVEILSFAAPQLAELALSGCRRISDHGARSIGAGLR
jgi:hypothetical protein